MSSLSVMIFTLFLLFILVVVCCKLVFIIKLVLVI
nr:MAG TPA: hypothetical protein [Caudoviricetes sp.]